jgi:hypothetical protein
VILVDPAIWPWRGRRWSHLVSDESYTELHRFAAELGLRRLSFQGDHYDVDEPTRARALALGAEPVGSRELLRRLRSAGLRRPRAAGPWRWQVLGQWPVRVLVGRSPGSWPAPWPALLDRVPPGDLVRLLQPFADGDPSDHALRLLGRAGEVGVAVVKGTVDAVPLAELVVEVREVEVREVEVQAVEVQAVEVQADVPD